MCHTAAHSVNALTLVNCGVVNEVSEVVTSPPVYSLASNLPTSSFSFTRQEDACNKVSKVEKKDSLDWLCAASQISQRSYWSVAPEGRCASLECRPGGVVSLKESLEISTSSSDPVIRE